MTIARWAETKANPEVSKITVLNKGNTYGSKVSSTAIPTGGQTLPILIEGERLAWKNAQKNGKKSIASDAKNKIIP
jgi:hypothetical protein